jgi:hypothetical protein
MCVHVQVYVHRCYVHARERAYVQVYVHVRIWVRCDICVLLYVSVDMYTCM